MPRFVGFWPKLPARNSFRIRTYKNLSCKPFRMRTYKKRGGVPWEGAKAPFSVGRVTKAVRAKGAWNTAACVFVVFHL